MAELYVSLTNESGVGIITLNRPPVNAYNDQFMRELGSAVEAARADEEVRAVIVRSALDNFFSAGADLEFFRKSSLNEKATFISLAHDTLGKMERTPKVFIAALNGHTLGGGLEVALACDLRFAAQGKSKLGQPEVTLALLPGNGGTQRLPRLIGKSRAIDLMITGRTLSPDEALQIGIVDRVFPKEELFSKTMDYAKNLATGATLAIGLIKRAVQEGSEVALESGLAYEREVLSRVFASEDAAEGVRAFLEKRPPMFKGR